MRQRPPFSSTTSSDLVPYQKDPAIGKGQGEEKLN